MMRMKNRSKIKTMNKPLHQKHRSIIAGGLTSSAGIFISKAIGILYVSPFQTLATDANIAYYSYGYTLYDIALQLTIAGIPVAIAVIIAKYYANDDIATVLLVRKIARILLLIIGLLSMVFIVFFATPLAKVIVTENVSDQTIAYTSNVLRLISVAMLITPVLGSYRSIFQGLKYFDEYATSQVLEQFVRVGFLLLLSYVLVVIIGLDPMWAVYMAILAASIAGVAAIIHLHIKEKPIIEHLKQKEQITNNIAIPIKTIIKEIFLFSIPYMIISLLGRSTSFVNLLFFNRAMFMISEDADLIGLLYGMIMFSTQKLISIPQVLAIGFSAAVIPYISEALNTNNIKQLKKHIFDAIESVLYFSILLSAGLLFFATPIYYLFFQSNYELGGQVLMYAASGGMLLAVAPVTSSIMIIVRLRKKIIVTLIIMFVVHLALIFPMIYLLGYAGAIYASYIAHVLVIVANLWILKKQFNLRYKGMIRRTMVLLLSMGVFYLSYQLSVFLQVDYYSNRLLTLLYIVIFGGLGTIMYVGLTWFFNIPQTIFNVTTLKSIFKR